MNGSHGSRRRTPQQIADALRQRIHAGELRAGDRLPTQAELADEFGVERGAVRQALRELQEEGLLGAISKGSPPRVAEPVQDRDEPRPTAVGLAPRLMAAFSAPQVRIDVTCLTAVSLLMALGEPLREIHAGLIRPESIDLRILLPSRDISLAFPVPVEGRGDDDPLQQRWLAQRNAQGQVLKHNLLALRSTHGIDVHVTFRALPLTPPVKLYLFNREEALIGYYMLTRREERMEGGTMEMYDALGSQSLLFSFEKNAGQRDTAFVEQSQMWFDALWETIASDLTLS